MKVTAKFGVNVIYKEEGRLRKIVVHWWYKTRRFRCCVSLSYSRKTCIGPVYVIQNKAEATTFRVFKSQTGWVVIFVAKWHKGSDCNWTFAIEALSLEIS